MRTLSTLLFPVVFSAFACGAPAEPAAPKPAEPAAVATNTATPPSPSTAAPANETGAKAEADAKAPAVEASPPTVKLIEAGTAPKKALRYRFKAGISELAEMDMKMSLAMQMGDRAAPKTDLPTIRTTMRIDAKEITPEGDLRCTFNTEKVDILKDVKVDAKVREGLEKEIGGLVGMHGKARISTRGVTSESDFELPPGASPALSSQMETLRDALRQMYVPFPEEEVGKGAKWEVTSRLPVNGALVDTKIAYALTKLDADSAQADVETTLSAIPNQTMKIAALPGASATLESLSGKGAGKASPSFVHLVGTGANKIAMESSFRVSVKGQTIEMKMQSDVAVALRAGKAKK